MSKTIRIRTTPGGADKYVTLNINQEFDFLEILSLKLTQEEVYRNFCADYGAVVGRVIANGGFGVPNAKVSIFVPISEEDKKNPLIYGLYPFEKVTDKNDEGIRYNLLPEDSQGGCHVAVGTMPSIRKVLDNDVILEVFEKYYKFTATTNKAGDYMIFGVPVGSHMVHVDVDISNIGFVSQKPYEMMANGFNENLFESNTRFKKSNNLDNLAQIKSKNIGVNVTPFWGDPDNCEVGIARVDVDLNYDIIPTSMFMGSIFGDDGKHSVNKRCKPRKKLGRICDTIANEGTIEMIRMTPDGAVEPFSVKGDRLIDEDGVWAFQIPMNLNRVVTDEFGNLIPSEDQSKGIPTEAKVRFRIGMDEAGSVGRIRSRAKFLVPNMNNDYSFDETTPTSELYTMKWKKIYTVRQFIARYQTTCGPRCADKRSFVGIKDVDDCGSHTAFPFNRVDTDLNPLYSILCILMQIIVIILTIFNSVIVTIINLIITVINAIIVNVLQPIVNFLNNFIGTINTIIDKVNKICDDCLGGLSIPTISVPQPLNYIPCITITCNDEVYAPGCIGGSNGYNATSPLPDHYGVNSGVMDCLSASLAEALNVFEFDFYNDWINGTLYAFLFKYKVKYKKRKEKTYEKFCDYDCGSYDNHPEHSKNNCHSQYIVETCVPKAKDVNSQQIDEGIIKEFDDNLYYPAKTHNGSLLLYATNITEIGSSVDCDIDGYKYVVDHLLPTTYNLPPIVHELDSSGNIEVTGLADSNDGFGNSVDGLLLNINCLGVFTTAQQCTNIKKLCEIGMELDEDNTDVGGSLPDQIISDPTDVHDEFIRQELRWMNTPGNVATEAAFRNYGSGLNFPQNSSYFFYFGIHPGKTALDKLKNLYFIECEQPALNPFTINYTSTHVTVYSGSNGTITTTIVGGTGPYTYSWTGPGGFTSTSANLSGLVAGTYTVTVTDSLGQSATINIVISQPFPMFVGGTITGATTNGSATGAIVTTISGGIGPYTYSWTGPGGFTSSSPNIINVVSGTYTVTVTDSLGQTVTTSFFVPQPAATIISLVNQTNVACFGGNSGAIVVSISGGTAPYTYSWTGPGGFTSTSQNINTLVAGTYTLVATDANTQTGTFSTTITQPANLVVTTSGVNPTCYGSTNGSASAVVSGGVAPYAYNWSNGGTSSSISGIGSGTYQLIVTDSNGCSKTVNQTLVNPPKLEITAMNINNHVSCFGGSNGSITAIVTGGTGTITYAWSGGGSSPTKTGLAAGNHTLTVTDVNGCTHTSTATITQPTQLNVVVSNFGPASGGNANGFISILPSGGTPPYTYAWAGPSGYTSTSQNIVNIYAGTYTVTVTDNNGCTKAISQTV